MTFRFFIAGIVKSIFSLTLYAVIFQLTANPYAAFSVSFLATVFFSAFIKGRFVFRRGVNPTIYAHYFLFAVGYFAFSQALIFFMGLLNLNMWLAPILVPAILFLPSFYISRFIFKSRKNA